MSHADPIEKRRAAVTGNASAEKTLVFVNGFGEDQSAWMHVAPAFARDFRLVTFDHAGTGGTAGGAFPQHRYLNLRAYARDMVELADSLALRDAVAVGHSVGGTIALLAAIERPAAFGKLVLIGASPRYLDDAVYRGGFSEDDLQKIYRAVALDYAEWADDFAPRVMDNPDRPQLAQHFAQSLKTIAPEHALTALCAIFQSDHRADLPKVTQPALIVQSRDDIAVPAEVARYLHEHIRGSRLAVIDARGHFPHLSAPEQVVAAIAEFVRS